LSTAIYEDCVGTEIITTVSTLGGVSVLDNVSSADVVYSSEDLGIVSIFDTCLISEDLTFAASV
jgi:hypothetical protein